MFGEILVSNVFVVFGEIRVSNVFLVFGEMLLRVSTVFLVHSGHTNLTKKQEVQWTRRSHQTQGTQWTHGFQQLQGM